MSTVWGNSRAVVCTVLDILVVMHPKKIILMDLTVVVYCCIMFKIFLGGIFNWRALALQLNADQKKFQL